MYGVTWIEPHIMVLTTRKPTVVEPTSWPMPAVRKLAWGLPTSGGRH